MFNVGESNPGLAIERGGALGARYEHSFEHSSLLEFGELRWKPRSKVELGAGLRG